MKLDHAWIAARIPHAGSMCLLDGIEDWAEGFIVCRASSHRLPNNPLRTTNRLGIANGIEYCAQAMAAHGALLAGSNEAARVGYLTSVREVEFHARRFDDIETNLAVRAELLSGDGNSMLYAFTLSAKNQLLLSGRASVRLDANRT